MNQLPQKKATDILKQGGIIAYPTEAVYGLGCDPFNKQAFYKILTLKKRPVEKGLILIASAWKQIKNLVTPIPPEKLEKILQTWPGANTWVFPANAKVPTWITGAHSTVALRITAHEIAANICKNFNGPIVSTSANIEGELPLKSYQEIKNKFADKIDFIVPGNVGPLNSPTIIRDAITNRVLRTLLHDSA